MDIESLSINNKVLLCAVEKGYIISKDNTQILSPKNKVLVLVVNKANYFNFCIRYNGKPKNILVHRYVAYFKYGNKIFENGIVVRHLDNNSLNNSFDNIAIGTQADNILDNLSENRLKYAINASHTNRRSTDAEVYNIRNDRNNGYTYKEICERYNTSKSVVNYILKRAKYY